MTSTLHQLEMDYWINHDLFSFQWWAILIMNAIFLILFILLIDRQRILLITLAFMISYVINNIFDDIGEYFQLWSHPHQLVQFLSPVATVEFIIVPSIMALMYQMFSRWKFFLIVDFIVSLIISFIVQPIFVYLNIYKLHNWTYFYSLLVLFVIGVVVKIIVDFIKMKQLNHL
ncbi:CBO0543 family protein [Bacillus sp. V2I10]|uniref:CBO0543 family protein n=1 Tax=Bacillus sp. V2I10 TaxID=3042276 RepID=UPI0027D8D7AC|nr:CBO0543 family protein [Bacillus sp. V2I10]